MTGGVDAADRPDVIDVRRAGEHDAVELAELRWACRAEGGEIDSGVDRATFVEVCARFLRREMAAGRQANWIAVHGGRIVAHIDVHIVPMLPRPCRPDDAFGVVTANYTIPELRGRGIATRLLNRAVAWAEDEDLELLIVWPSERAVSLYRRAGFTGDHDILQRTLRPYAP